MQVLTEKQLTFFHLLISNGSIRLLVKINPLATSGFDVTYLLKRGNDTKEFYVFANALEAFNIVAGTDYGIED